MTTTPFEERPASDPETTIVTEHGHEQPTADDDGASPATDGDREDLMPESTPFRTPAVTETE